MGGYLEEAFDAWAVYVRSHGDEPWKQKAKAVQ